MNTNDNDKNKLTEGDEFMSELIEEQVIYTMSPDLRNSYDRDESLRDEGREEGREQGREEGREQGREEGREQGRVEGLKEAIKNNAINLYKNGAAKELISKSLNITSEELEEILKDI